jgi:hypothetical protein
MSIRIQPEDISGIAGTEGIEGIAGILGIIEELFLAFLIAELSGIKLLTSTLFLPAVFIWLDGGNSFLLVAKQGVNRDLGASQGSRRSVGRVLHARLRPSAVSATCIDILTLLGRGADASTVAREARVAALRLALVILKEEEVVGTHLNLRAVQGLIRGCSTP